SPVEVIKDEDGRAKALRVVPVELVDGKLQPKEGEEFEIDCTLIVSATGQAGDYTGIEEFDNGWGLMDADNVYQVKGKPGHFVAGDAVNPHLLTTAIGQASIAAEGLHHYLMDQEIPSRPKIDTHHFKLLEELRVRELEPSSFEIQEAWGTDTAEFAIHNYEDRSSTELATHDQLHMAYFDHEPMNRRQEANITADEVLNNFQERFSSLEEQKAVDEAERCMSCGMCFECDNCVVYCPEDAIFRVNKDQRAMGRYVDTDYDKCVGCHICADVCPSGYIKMGLTY
ncbi:MAG: 4Fe-4S dicluster domain-containing protein, partial [Gammaproteobacteria bacterium]|nr:4Fe-4S dicluster domain-containing protein [Gammaproteobacteria bacterium]